MQPNLMRTDQGKKGGLEWKKIDYLFVSVALCAG